MKISIQTICQVAIFAAIIAICAQIRMPLVGGVPFTLQTTGVALAGAILGWKKGVVAVSVYILLGAIGLPVFNGPAGGIGIIFGPTGGFILTFPLLALAAAIGARKAHIAHWAAWISLGVAVNLTLGSLWLAFERQITLAAAFSAGMTPFWLTSLIQIAIVITAGKTLRYALVKARINI